MDWLFNMSPEDLSARTFWLLSALAAWVALAVQLFSAIYKNRPRLKARALIQSRSFDHDGKRNISDEKITVYIQSKGRLVEVTKVTFFPWEMAEVGKEFETDFQNYKLEPNHSIEVEIKSPLIRELEYPLHFRKLTVCLREGRCIPVKVKGFKKCCKEVVEYPSDDIFDSGPMFTGGGNYLEGCMSHGKIPNWWTRWRDKVPSKWQAMKKS